MFFRFTDIFLIFPIYAVSLAEAEYTADIESTSAVLLIYEKQLFSCFVK
jgi:hypothetical protein